MTFAVHHAYRIDTGTADVPERTMDDYIDELLEQRAPDAELAREAADSGDDGMEL